MCQPMQRAAKRNPADDLVHAPRSYPRRQPAAVDLQEETSARSEASFHALREEPAPPASDLSAAEEAVRARLDELRGRPDLVPAVSVEERREFLLQLDARRQLVTRQRALEDWMEDWSRARH